MELTKEAFKKRPVTASVTATKRVNGNSYSFLNVFVYQQLISGLAKLSP